MGDVYEANRDDDGFLYLLYTDENAFGWIYLKSNSRLRSISDFWTAIEV